MMRIRALTLSLSMFLCAAAKAELKWEQTTIELHPAVGDHEAIGHFKYQNVGNEPIRFKSVHSSCGCTTAQSQKEDVAAGEQGEITATFKIGNRVGLQVKTVTIETDDPAHAISVLTLRAVLPELLEIKPTFVYWQLGELAKPKTILVHASKVFPVKQLKVSSSSPDFQTEVQQVGDGEFKIDVGPKQTTHTVFATLNINADNWAKTFHANARVTSLPIAR